MLAHQGGWDEILIVIGPMVLIGTVLAFVRRRLPVVEHDVPPVPRSGDADSGGDASSPTDRGSQGLPS